ncbi:acetate--CoA ligase family protein [Enterovirga sp.]|uniref:acetate--CoA ligase family protein n=1 Tax=Enterovirga sp. TaxID=2026350 RepID=UPI002CC70EBB|nr:acetate--CoA ligase family protein [Enterovirga sp.]HMO28136.1 acetate--CoA ligase family protein [Enterovirga sp.]
MATDPGAVEKLLRPRSVAIVGASPRPGSFGGQLLTAATSLGFGGDIFLVNPRYREIGGRPCHPSLRDLPSLPDTILVGVSDRHAVASLAEAAELSVPGAVLFGRLHGETEAGTPLAEAAGRIAREGGIAVCGGNCMGYVNTIDGIQATGMPFAALPRPGGLALISHSGSTWSGLVGNQRGLGFDFAISAGQELATNVSDYVHFLLERTDTRVIACVIETLRDPSGFIRALGSARKKGVPVIVLKLGRSEAGRRFAISHSGALSGSNAAYEAVFQRCGAVSVRTLDELLDTVELFACSRRPRVPGFAVGTDSGGERQLIVDLAADIGLAFAELQPATLERLAGRLDPGLEASNPLDYWGDGADVMAPCLEAMAADPHVGMVAMATNLPPGRAFVGMCVQALETVHAATDKPVVMLGNMASTMSREAVMELRGRGIPALMGTETGLRAVKHVLDYIARGGEGPFEPRIPQPAAASAGLGEEGHGPLLRSADGFRLLERHGIRTAPWRDVATPGEAQAFAGKTGFPVVLKIDDPAIAHKSEVGGVAVNLDSPEALRAAFGRLRARHPAAPLLVQKQMAGRELILGMTRDVSFGPIVTVGLGGIFVEIFGDTATLVPPYGREEALAALRRLRSYPILAGARGQEPADLAALADTLVAFGDLAAAIGERVSELEINPLLAGPGAAVAVDCLAVRPALPGEPR